MVPEEKIRNWAFQNANSLNLEISTDWELPKWLPEHYHSRVKITHNGYTSIGRGISRNEHISLAKAISESLERLYCIRNKIHSNGIAFHYNIEAAKENSRNELLERSLILCHHYSGTPLKMVTLMGHNISPQAENLTQMGYTVTIGESLYLNNHQAIACFIGGTNSKGKHVGAFGASCTHHKSSSIENAFIEACATISYYNNKSKFDSLDINEFLDLKEHSPSDHGKLLLDPVYFQEITSAIKRNCVKREKINSEFDVEYQRLVFNDNLLDSAPIVGIKAVSNHLLTPRYGTTPLKESELANLLKTIERNDLKLNPLPHPIG